MHVFVVSFFNALPVANPVVASSLIRFKICRLHLHEKMLLIENAFKPKHQQYTHLIEKLMQHFFSVQVAIFKEESHDMMDVGNIMISLPDISALSYSSCEFFIRIVYRVVSGLVIYFTISSASLSNGDKDLVLRPSLCPKQTVQITHIIDVPDLDIIKTCLGLMTQWILK
jgi:hypothetical protein